MRPLIVLTITATLMIAGTSLPIGASDKVKNRSSDSNFDLTPTPSKTAYGILGLGAGYGLYRLSQSIGNRRQRAVDRDQANDPLLDKAPNRWEAEAGKANADPKVPV